MKYSFMSFSCPEFSLGAFLEAARTAGYDAVEPRAQAGHGHGIETSLSAAERDTVRSASEAAGIPFSCVATSCCFADPAAAPGQIETALTHIDLAADIGCSRIRVFGGAIPEGISRDSAVSGVAESLLRVADRAEERGVRVCLETHDHWCHPDDVAAVMRRVNRPGIRVNWDIMHPVRTARVSMASAFATLRPYIAHVHFHDGVTRDGKLVMVPIGTGDIDHRSAVMLLASRSYDGYLSGEWIGWEPASKHLARELTTMKGYETEE